VFAHAIAVAADIDQVTVMQDPVDHGSRHDLISEDLAPFLEAFVGGKFGRGMFVAPVAPSRCFAATLNEGWKKFTNGREAPTGA
jgi:hypothetical protein